MLNSSVVHYYERRDSELQYLRGLLGACAPRQLSKVLGGIYYITFSFN